MKAYSLLILFASLVAASGSERCSTTHLSGWNVDCESDIANASVAHNVTCHLTPSCPEGIPPDLLRGHEVTCNNGSMTPKLPSRCDCVERKRTIKNIANFADLLESVPASNWKDCQRKCENSKKPCYFWIFESNSCKIYKAKGDNQVIEYEKSESSVVGSVWATDCDEFFCKGVDCGLGTCERQTGVDAPHCVCPPGTYQQNFHSPCRESDVRQPRDGSESAFSGESPTWVFGGSSYEIDSRQFRWGSAQARAVERGGHLVHVDSPQEQEFIDTKILQGEWEKSVLWIGLSGNGRGADGDWAWTSGKLPTYVNWNSDQPSNGSRVGPCVTMNFDYSTNGSHPVKGKWHNSMCAFTLPALIEFDSPCDYSHLLSEWEVDCGHHQATARPNSVFSLGRCQLTPLCPSRLYDRSRVHEATCVHGSITAKKEPRCDIDECASDATNDCLPDATCFNTPHSSDSYTCVCPPGFEGDGKTTCLGIGTAGGGRSNASVVGGGGGGGGFVVIGRNTSVISGGGGGNSSGVVGGSGVGGVVGGSGVGGVVGVVGGVGGGSASPPTVPSPSPSGAPSVAISFSAIVFITLTFISQL